MKSNLRLAGDEDDPTTRQDVAMAQIDQGQREWIGPNGLPWKSFDEPQKHSALPVDEIQGKSYKVIIVDNPTPLYRRVLQFIGKLRAR